MKTPHHLFVPSLALLALSANAAAAAALVAPMAMARAEAANAFVSVTPLGGGIERRGGRGFAVSVGDGETEVELRAQPGWRLLTPARVRVSRGATPRYRVVSDDGEQSGGGDILGHDEIRESVHDSDPEGRATLAGGGAVFVAGTNAVHLASFAASAVLDKPGRHAVTITSIDYRNGEEVGRSVETSEEEISPDRWTWTWSFGPHRGTAEGATLSVSDLELPIGRHRLAVSVHGANSTCERCKVDAAAETNLLVWSLATETVVPEPAPASRRRIGVGEGVKIIAVPEGETGDATWTKSGDGSLCARECNPVRYTAGATAGEATVTATLPGGSSGSVDFQIVAPQSLLMRRTSSTRQSNPLMITMAVDMLVAPSDVDFSSVTFGEGSCEAVADGYFKNEDGDIHPASGSFIGTETLEAGVGWRLTDEDTICAMTSGPQYSAGTFRWPIPWSYEVAGETHEFATANHNKRITMSGRIATLSFEKCGAADSATATNRLW